MIVFLSFCKKNVFTEICKLDACTEGFRITFWLICGRFWRRLVDCNEVLDMIGEIASQQQLGITVDRTLQNVLQIMKHLTRNVVLQSVERCNT